MQGYYSGYNLTIYCYQNDTCNINCLGNSCFNTFVYCSGICNIECDNYNSSFCAQTLSPNESISIQDIKMIDETDFFKLYLNQISLENEQRCNNYTSIFNRPLDANATKNVNVTFGDENGNICCRGSQSCYNMDTITIQTEKNKTKTNINDIICSGRESCKDTFLIRLDRFSNVLHCF